MYLIYFTGFCLLYKYIGNYIILFPQIILFHNYYKNVKMPMLDDKKIYTKYIKLFFNNTNINFNNNYIENKIIYFKDKYEYDEVKDYNIKDKYLYYSILPIIKIDSYFLNLVNELLLFILYYLKIIMRYFINQQFSNFKNTKVENTNIEERKINLLKLMKKKT